MVTCSDGFAIKEQLVLVWFNQQVQQAHTAPREAYWDPSDP